MVASITLPPAIINGIGHAGEPGPVLGEFPDLDGAEILGAIGQGAAQWLKQPSGHQHRDVVGLAVKRPGRLLRGETGRWLRQQR